MRAREAAKIFVDDGMTDLMIFLSLAERVEEEGMAVQVHCLAFVSLFSLSHDTSLTHGISRYSRGYIIYCNDITPLQLHHYTPCPRTSNRSSHIRSSLTPLSVIPYNLKLLGILTKTIEN